MLRARPGEDPPTVAEVVAAIVRRPDWQARAACLGAGVDLFFPPRGQSTAAAKALCATCPVVAECQDYALETDAEAGIWGGMGARALRRRPEVA